jgi:response regulator RpfG family c-di-GMP phosphodiesterase
VSENPLLPQATLLLVDDEENILNSLRRILRREPYSLLTATGGEEALAAMAQHQVDLVISDARMPGMDGASLLARIQQQWPDCIRIMLTGYADVGTTVKAINEGKIYRYISKPWDDDELRLIVRQALAHQRSERERKRLEELTHRQNEELQELNETLEQRVIARTKESRQAADMLDLAYQELRRSYVTATEVFSSLIAQRLPAKKQPNARVIALVKAYAETHHLDEELSRDLAMAAALYNIGKLTWNDELLSFPSDLLPKEKRLRYRQYPETGESLLMALEPLQGAAKLIRHHQERWSGNGFPDQLKEEAIPFGARLLKLAVDFIELQNGLILERRVARDYALKLLKRYAGRFYDPEICEHFIQVCIEQMPDVAPEDIDVLMLETRRLEPGMKLARNLHSNTGMLLLKQDQVLTEIVISKLVAFEATDEGEPYTLAIQKPEEPEV